MSAADFSTGFQKPAHSPKGKICGSVVENCGDSTSVSLHVVRVLVDRFIDQLLHSSLWWTRADCTDNATNKYDYHGPFLITRKNISKEGRDKGAISGSKNLSRRKNLTVKKRYRSICRSTAIDRDF